MANVRFGLLWVLEWGELVCPDLCDVADNTDARVTDLAPLVDKAASRVAGGGRSGRSRPWRGPMGESVVLPFSLPEAFERA